jgi:hypothetical protein
VGVGTLHSDRNFKRNVCVCVCVCVYYRCGNAAGGLWNLNVGMNSPSFVRIEQTRMIEGFHRGVDEIFHCSDMSHSVDWYLVTDISGKPIGIFLEGQAVLGLLGP